jgi:carbon monoxide dehydrogenase subunit G
MVPFVEFTDEFRVSLPADPAWELLGDVERIAPCMPGARLTGAEGDKYQGTVKVRVGPVVVEFKGTAIVESRDKDARAMSIRAAGRDSRGQGNADAVVTALLAPDGDGTRVTVTTQLTITGKVAQFGKGVIEDVSKKLLAQFTTNLEDMLAAERSLEAPAEATAAVETQAVAKAKAEAETAPAAQTTETPRVEAAAAQPALPQTAGQETAGQETAARKAAAEAAMPEAVVNEPAAQAPPARQATAPVEPEPIDLLGVASGAILKRLIPAAVVVLVIVGIVLWLTL